MPRLCTAVLAAAIVVVPATRALADTILLATLTNAAENPPTTPTTSTGAARPASFGTAIFTLNDAMTELRFTASVVNIDFTGSQTADTFDNLIAAHIHASPTVTPTTNAGVVWGFFGTPFNDNSPNDVVFQPFPMGVGGMISGKWDLMEGNGTTLAAQLPNILSGHSYINFHTTQFGGGEIRGNIAAVTPEPATMLLVGLPIAALIRRSARERRQRRMG
jgi:CHRD domain-containing protein